MKEMNVPKLTADDTPLFLGILSDLFTGVEVPPNDNPELRNALTEELRNQGLAKVDIILTKAAQLYETKITRHGTMVVGETGSAKSTTWKLLKAALTTLAKTNPDKYVPVKTYSLNPKALSLRELYGQYNLATNEWSDGVLSSIMRTACSDEKKDQKWVVFDGPVDTLWIESMNTVLDDNKVLTLINGERIALPDQVSLLFEVGDLSVASPATVSRCGMIYMDQKDLGWRPFIDSWLEKRQDKQSIDVLRRLIDKYVPQTFDFRRTCEQLVPVSEIAAVRSLCKLFDAVATTDNGVKAEEDTYARMIELWFLFSLIWSLGGSLVDASRRSFDMFLREIEGQFPSKDTVYEYVVDKQKKTWVSWEDKLLAGWRYSPTTPFYKLLVPTVDTVRYEFLFQVLLANKVPVLLVGDVGIGKTILMDSILQTTKETSSVITINMSARTSSERVQTILESKIEKRTKNIYVPIGGKQLVCFVDDFNMPSKDDFGSQPALEFIKHWMDYGFWFDRQKQTLKYANDILMLACMGPPGGGRNVISPRVQSRFQVINMTFPSESSIARIYGTIINQKLQDFDEDVKPLGDIMTIATTDIYHNVVAHFLPTPVKMHYVFNLRDISKVFQGLLRAQREYYDSRESMAKLWVHESVRVFSDRLVTAQDRDSFSEILNEKLNVHFQMSLASLFTDRKITVFGDFMNDHADNAVYEEISDSEKLKRTLEEKLEDYNMEPGNIQLDLVLFKDAMEHICRIIRVLRQPAGHMFLIGVGGSGRQSLARLATFVIGMKLFLIKISKYYRMTDFREDLKTLYKQTGMDGQPTAFLFTDSHILHEEMLEDFSSMLSSGDVPNLFPPDEFSEIREALRPMAAAEKVPDTQESLYAFFIERVRNNLHCLLCMSPAGVAFRNRLRMFPALINCTTIDWFTEWPEDALLEVAIRYLEGSELGSDSLRKSIGQVFVTVHTSVIKYAAKMASELKRYYYITPTNYLELVSGYRELLKSKRKEIGESANKLKNGLSKLDDTKQNVEKISIELETVKKQVSQYQKQCEDYLVIIVQQKREADEQAKGVAAKSEKLGAEEEEVRAVADAAQADLDQALPALDAATKALEGLNKKDLQEVKSYGKPPPLVEKVMEAVMVLKKCEPTWDESKRQLGNPNFIKQLINYDKENMSDKILKKTSQYCADENFNPEIVGRVSLASKSLCMWVKAMETYGHIYRQVAPKKEKLKAAQDQLEKKQKSLKEAKAKLQEIQDKLAQLEKQYDEKVSLKEKLRADSEETELKLSRAEQLVQGLSGERERWENSIKVYEQSLNFLPGDCLFGAAYSSYAGPFNSVYRQKVVQEAWLPAMKTLEIPCNPDVSFVQFMGKSTEIREWSIQGLPSDPFSVENGIIVTRGRRWPVMIDPQGQAKAWIKNMEAKRDLKIIDLKQSDYLRTLENAIQYGVPVLLQDVSEVIDPALDPVLNKSVIKKQGVYVIRLGDKEIEYNPDFKFYITTKMANPHYAPEVFAKSTIVNFAVKEKGLEDQLLGIVVKREKPELEEQKNSLVVNVAQARKQLVQLEDEILHLLTTAQGSLLDDEKLVTALQSSKTIAEQVTLQLKISEQTEAQIDVAREGYRPCAQRASILYFVLNDMAMIDPMYQFSLDSYVDLFEKSIAKSKRSDDLNDRLVSLNEYHTFAVYRNTCRGLFEKHKLLFSLQMTVKILEASGKLNKDEYDFLLRGGQVLDRNNQPTNPYTEWLREDEWDNVTELDKLPAFKSLISSLEQSERDWKSWYMTPEPEETSLPGEWNSKVTEFQKMLIIRAFRPDRIIFCAQRFIVTNLGQKFIEPPILNVEEVLSDSSAHTPLIFVLSPGVDPTGMIHTLAKKSNMEEKFTHLSLGQGQSPKAVRLIEEGIINGHWVFLANCHLSISWMPSLDKIVEGLGAAHPHEGFRLWLSSSPHPQFPISILQNGIKMTTEPPAGLKANMSRLYGKATEATFPRSKKPEVYKKLFFSLCFFHSVLLERRKFLTLGWNIPYDFNDSDFEVCENLVAILLDEYDEIAWDALKYLIAEVNYGGRVTDEWDRRILRSYINQLFCDDAVKVPMYTVSPMATYYIPDGGDLNAHREYIRSLPNFDKPEVFGQHSNADIASQIRESANMLSSLLCLQPQISTGQGATREEKVLAIAVDIQKRVPEDIEMDPILRMLSEDRSPLNVVLLQEVQRYNQLLQIIRRSLGQLENSIKGIVVMSAELEEIFNCMFEAKVPPVWSKAYMSLKPLGSWTRDLILRIEHFYEWSKGNEPKAFWLGAFTFPTSFLTAVLQKNARRYNVPIDVLSWEFTVLQTEDESTIQGAPKDGVYVRGISLEGAR
jgi:dynein heavy chain